MKRRNRGVTLFEVLLAIAIVSSLAGFGLRAYVLSSRVAAVNRLAHERLELSREFDAAMREIIQSATGTAARAADYERKDGTLVLQLPARGALDRRAVVSRVPESGAPFILTMDATGSAWELERVDTYRQPLSLLKFTEEPSGLITCRYRIAFEPGEREHDAMPVHEVYAAPRGLSWEQTP